MSLLSMNKIAEIVPAEILPEIFDLDMQTGSLHWRVRPVDHFPADGKKTQAARAAMWNGKYAGRRALTTRDPRGYLFGAIAGKNVYAHRVICAMVNGVWPEGEVDHINRDKTDNRPSNLRVVSHSENRLNTADVDRAAQRRAMKPKKRTLPGIRRGGKTTWSVRAKRDGKEQYIGTFRCFGRALLARACA